METIEIKNSTTAAAENKTVEVAVQATAPVAEAPAKRTYKRLTEEEKAQRLADYKAGVEKRKSERHAKHLETVEKWNQKLAEYRTIPVDLDALTALTENFNKLQNADQMKRAEANAVLDGIFKNAYAIKQQLNHKSEHSVLKLK